MSPPPSDLAALKTQAMAAHRANALDVAARLYQQILTQYPAEADIWFNLATLLHGAGQLEPALIAYEQVLALQPQNVDAHLNRGVALRSLGREQEALAAYDRALALRPDAAMGYVSRANLLLAQGKREEARRDYDRAVQLAPGMASAYANRACLLMETGEFSAALADFDRAVQLDAAPAKVWLNRGNALVALGDDDGATASYSQAIARHPAYPEAHVNRGLALQSLRRTEAALADFDAALALRPDYLEARYNKALCRLQAGDYAQGWPDYEARWGCAAIRDPIRHFPVPLWTGEQDVAGRTVLLHAEQGLGDTIQFCRYVPLVAARGARVVLEVPGALVTLMTGLAGAAQVVARGAALPPFDLHCPLLSLPRAFATTLDTIPAPIDFPACDAARLDHWRARLGPATKPRVGLVWSGNPTHGNDQHRSMPLATLAPLLSGEVEAVSLQREIRPADAEWLAGRGDIRHFGTELTDFIHTAALCMLMDVIVSVDTSVAHLAGTLGRPVCIMLPDRNTDWRWLWDRTDSPWYPSATLWRRQPGESWPQLVARMAPDLHRRLQRP